MSISPDITLLAVGGGSRFYLLSVPEFEIKASMMDGYDNIKWLSFSPFLPILARGSRDGVQLFEFV
jgi:hypothetical protein